MADAIDTLESFDIIQDKEMKAELLYATDRKRDERGETVEEVDLGGEYEPPEVDDFYEEPETDGVING